MAHTTMKGAAAVAVAGALALTACAGGSTPSGSDAATDGAPPEIGGEVGFSFWGSPARAEKVDAVIDLFEAAHEGATVNPEVADYFAYIERLTVRAAGGDLACVSGAQTTFLSQYADNGVLAPLDPMIESGQIDVSGIPEDVLAAGQIDGQQFMIPTGTFVRVIGYNESLLEESGAPAPDSDMTWAEYADWLRAIQEGLPEGVYAGENEGGIMFTLTSWVIGHGETMFADGALAFSEETLAEFLQYWIDLAEDGVVVPPTMIPDQNGALELTPIATGTAVAGSRDVPHLFIMEQSLEGAGIPSAVPWFSMPSESADQSANVLGANGLAIPEECDNPDTAAAFVDFFANDVDANVAFQSDNGILTNVDAQEALLADAATPEGVKRNVTVLRELTEAGDLTTTTYPTGLSTLNAELLRVYQAAAFGEMTVDEAVDAFFTSAEEALN